MENKKTTKKTVKKPVAKKSQAVTTYPVPAMINKYRVLKAISDLQAEKEYASLVPFMEEIKLYIRHRK